MEQTGQRLVQLADLLLEELQLLQSFMEKQLGHPVSPWPPKTWDLQKLSLAGLYFNPTLESARSRLLGTEAAIITAGAHPNPTVSIAPGIPTPYLLTLDFAIPMETGGKRGHRIQVAHSEAQVREDQLAMLEKIFSAGEIPGIELDSPRMELSKIHVLIATTEGQLAEAKALLAAAIGIPVAGFQDVEFSSPEMDALPNIQSPSQTEIQRDAVVNRLDVRRALEQYAAAEASLQLEISKRYPDINIGPGYTFEETHSFLTFGLSSTLPLRNRNQGPIAEADARRKEAAAIVLEKQAQAIAKSDRALAAYKAALGELAQVESLRKLQNGQVETAQQAIRAGTSAQLNLDTVQIQGSILERTRLDALARAQRALGELETPFSAHWLPRNSCDRAQLCAFSSPRL